MMQTLVMPKSRKKTRLTTVKLIAEDLDPFHEIRTLLEPTEGRLTYISIMRKATRFYLRYLQELAKSAPNE